MLSTQENQLDEILGVTRAIRYEGENFGDEVTEQNKMLGTLNNEFDRTEIKMARVDNRLKQVIASSNQCYMYGFIIAEILCLIFLILL